jgi:hypothetical protein
VFRVEVGAFPRLSVSPPEPAGLTGVADFRVVRSGRGVVARSLRWVVGLSVPSTHEVYGQEEYPARGVLFARQRYMRSARHLGSRDECMDCTRRRADPEPGGCYAGSNAVPIGSSPPSSQSCGRGIVDQSEPSSTYTRGCIFAVSASYPRVVSGQSRLWRLYVRHRRDVPGAGDRGNRWTLPSYWTCSGAG